MIDVISIEYKINFRNKKTIIRTYKLKDGTEVIYLTNKHHDTRSNLFVFEKDELFLN